MKTIKIDIPSVSGRVLVIALHDGSWASPDRATLLALTPEQHKELCEGSEPHQLENDPEVVAELSIS